MTGFYLMGMDVSGEMFEDKAIVKLNGHNSQRQGSGWTTALTVNSAVDVVL